MLHVLVAHSILYVYHTCKCHLRAATSTEMFMEGKKCRQQPPLKCSWRARSAGSNLHSNVHGGQEVQAATSTQMFMEGKKCRQQPPLKCSWRARSAGSNLHSNVHGGQEVQAATSTQMFMEGKKCRQRDEINAKHTEESVLGRSPSRTLCLQKTLVRTLGPGIETDPTWATMRCRKTKMYSPKRSTLTRPCSRSRRTGKRPRVPSLKCTMSTQSSSRDTSINSNKMVSSTSSSRCVTGKKGALIWLVNNDTRVQAVASVHRLEGEETVHQKISESAVAGFSHSRLTGASHGHRR